MHKKISDYILHMYHMLHILFIIFIKFYFYFSDYLYCILFGKKIVPFFIGISLVSLFHEYDLFARLIAS